MFNSVILSGRMTADPELKSTRDGLHVTTFTIANEVGWGDKKKTSFLTGQAWADSPDEKTADTYAADTLLPSSYNDEVASLGSLSDVKRFAADHDLAPGIVIGRYRHITKRFSAFGDSVARFSWPEGEWKVA